MTEPSKLIAEPTPAAELATLRTLIRGVAENQDRQAQAFNQFRDETRRDIAEISRAVGNMNKLSWPVILGFVTTIVLVGGIAVGFVEMRNSDLGQRIADNKTGGQRNTQDLEAVKSRLAADAVTQGHTADAIATLAAGLGSAEGKTEASLARHREEIGREVVLRVSPIEQSIRSQGEILASLDARVRQIETGQFSQDEGRQLRERLTTFESDVRAFMARSAASQPE